MCGGKGHHKVAKDERQEARKRKLEKRKFMSEERKRQGVRQLKTWKSPK